MAPRLLIFSVLPLLASPLSCLTAAGAPADYWVLLKASGCANNTQPQCSYFFFYDPDAPPAASGASLNASLSLVLGSNALGATLSALATSRVAGNVGVFHWSDDPPERFLPLPTTAGAFNAHSKGVLAADVDGGFWLTHSWPEFPDTSIFGGGWGIGNASTIYGQSFLCVSLPLGAVEAVARALLAMEPRGYDSAVPLALRGTLPSLFALATGERNRSAPLPRVTTVATPRARNFTHVSKNGAWGGELYSGAVLPALGGRAAGDLWVETWRRSPALGSICNAQNGSVFNVDSLTVAEPGVGAAEQRYTTDHSKWAVAVCAELSARGNGTGSARGEACAAAPAFRPWVCVGDINMMSSQSLRGGGTVCFDHGRELWGRLVEGVSATSGCRDGTLTPSSSPTVSPSNSVLPSVTPSLTGTLSGTPSQSATPTATLSTGASPTCTPTQSQSQTGSGSGTQSGTLSGTPSLTGTLSGTPSRSATPTATLSSGASPTGAPTRSQSQTGRGSGAQSGTLGGAPSLTGTLSGTPSRSATPTATLSSGASPTGAPTPSPTATLSAGASPSATPSRVGGAGVTSVSATIMDSTTASTAVAAAGGAVALLVLGVGTGLALRWRQRDRARAKLLGRSHISHGALLPRSTSWRERHRRGVQWSVRGLRVPAALATANPAAPLPQPL